MNIGYILVVLAVLEVYLGFYLLTRYQRSQTTTYYALFALGSALYVGMNGLGYLTGSYFIGEKLSWFGGIIATIFFLPFSLSYPFPRKSFKDVLPWILWPLLIFGLGEPLTELFIENGYGLHYQTGYKTNDGEFFYFLIAFIFAFWAWSIVNLVRTYKIFGGTQRRLLKFVLIGTGISLAASIGFDILLPLFVVSKLGYIGSLFNAAWVAATAYILLRKPA